MQKFNTFLCLVLFVLSFACSSKKGESNLYEKETSRQPVTLPVNNHLKPDSASQIAQYVVEIFEDKKGHLWFGTMEKGVARYDGEALTYFSTKDGLIGNTVSSIAEDKEGNLWLGTHSGLSKYDGRKFTNFSSKEGLCNDRVSNILIDKAGNIWVGTWGGVCRFDGSTFSDFPLPKPDIEIPEYQETMNWVTKIMEDKQGNIWFSRSGYSVCKYDPNPPEGGASFTHYTKEAGLSSNCVQTMVEDKNGNIWFGSRVAEKDHPDPNKRNGNGGLSRYDSKTFIQYPDIEGLSKNDVYAIYEDKSGDIWIGAGRLGVYHYDGENFTLFNETGKAGQSNKIGGIQSILEDKNGTLWLGCSGGLFRLSGSAIINVTQGGPWL